jgi:hypothetical protein
MRHERLPPLFPFSSSFCQPPTQTASATVDGHKVKPTTDLLLLLKKQLIQVIFASLDSFFEKAFVAGPKRRVVEPVTRGKQPPSLLPDLT